MIYPAIAYWYALQVKSNYEQVVAECLEDVGIEGYVPLCKSTSRRPRNRFADGTPLIPGYVFAHLNLDRGPRMYSIPGVIRILGTGSIPTPIGLDEIEAIKVVTNSCLTVCPAPYMDWGTSIVVTGGPLRGVRGTFVQVKNRDLFTISLPLLRRSVAVMVPKEWVTELASEQAWQPIPP